MSFVPEGDTTNYNTFHKKRGGKNHPYTMKQTLKIKEGGWIPVYQQVTGITTEVNTLQPETRLVDRFYPCEQQHHLCLITLTSGCQ